MLASALSHVEAYVPTPVKETFTYVASNYVPESAKEAAQTMFMRAEETASFASLKVAECVEFGKGAVTYGKETIEGAVGFGTATVESGIATAKSLTPDPVLALIDQSLAKASAIRADPVTSLKEYVPDFVIQAGEKSYEVVSNSVEQGKVASEELGGFIVTKVNGVMQVITHIPQVEGLLAELKKLSAGTKA